MNSTQKVCTQCSKILPADAKFCDGCGMTQPSKFCPTCGKQLPADAKFCDGCGFSMAETGQSAAAGGQQRAMRAPRIKRELSANEKRYSQILSVGLAVLLVLSVLVTSVRDVAYRMYVSMDVEKFYDVVFEELGDGDDNPIASQLYPIFYQLSYYGVTEDDLIDFLNDKEFKKQFQIAINSYLDAFITGETSNLLGEKDIRKMLDTLRSTIQEILDIEIPKNRVESTAKEYATYISSFYNGSERHLKQSIKNFWEDEASTFLKILRPVAHPATNAVLLIFDILAIIGLVVLTRKSLLEFFGKIGIPFIIAGGLAFLLAVLKPLWAHILSETYSDAPQSIMSILLSGFAATAWGFTFAFLIIGLISFFIYRRFGPAK